MKCIAAQDILSELIDFLNDFVNLLKVKYRLQDFFKRKNIKQRK